MMLPKIRAGDSMDSGPTAEEVIACAIAGPDIPAALRHRRYTDRTVEQISKDLNHNWDVTRALLKISAEKDIQIESLKRAIKQERRIRKLLTGLVTAALTGSFIALFRSLVGIR
jgi:hypothetical protein